MKYNPALDGIRALAVLGVVASHGGWVALYPGYFGVDVFFVLSGFLITSILLQQARADGIQFGRFYLRRAARLYPTMLLMLAGYLLVAPQLVPGYPHWRDALLTALYLNDYAMGVFGVRGFLMHTWSLAVEEHFYLLWPLIVALLVKLRPPRVVVYLLAAAYITDTVWRLYNHVQLDNMMATWYRFDTHCSGLILGSLLAFVPQIKSRWWALLIPLCVWGMWASVWNGQRVFATTFAEWLSVAMILWGTANPGNVLGWKPLAYIGRISYGIYLFHFPISTVFYHAGCSWQETVGMTALSSGLLAHFSYQYLERPAQQLVAARQWSGKVAVGGVKFEV
jgi:peptidoglycan/LPS O-acetylase OafA/YrhL